ncbi:hypothetical protein LMJF_02_0470 [Leishmania major strain Friedlin]|uniref:Uncharacterized protein n=1 Tax=Leishmania major TaxID=5664 RepID=E9ACC1_LEIMA|nr:hypothetical protein LMJF_02_0470 [Leishmania major strain Friedlin]CAG9567200.1 hypothetical_protein_-_conserved [Leishmania major strain Friedlin]CBZ11937.1 hypothetical protein LMJF_02_0470 [Leishmania major strain Friedlin]|eukprot:XP_003721652.1 hypothetical protein LMJF_02_0470 [Leishmania major strain Friedlin]
MPSVTSVAAGTAAVGMGNAGSGDLLFPFDASVPTLRSSNPEDEAAAAELVRGQQRQQQQRRHQGSIGVSVDVSAVLDRREETGGAGDDRRHRQSWPRGSTSSSSHATRARQQGPSLQPPESSRAADSEVKDQPARQNSRRAYDDPKVFMRDTENDAPGTLLMRCEDEGNFALESVRVRRDVDRTAYHAKALGGSTANDSRVPEFAGFDALDDAVSAKAPATVARGVAVQHQGESVPARSRSSSLLAFSQELQRTLPPSAVITASDHYRRLRQQAMAHLPPSQASEAVDVEGPDTAQQNCPSPAAHRMHLHFSRCCSEPLCEAANSTRLRAGVPPSVLPPRSTSGATHPLPTTPPAGDYERDRSGEEEVEDAARDCAHSGEAAPLVTAHSSLSSVTDSSSRSPATTSVVQHIHSHHTAFVAAASSVRTHPPPPAPVTAASAAASTTPLEIPAASWRRAKVQRLATPPLVGSGLLRPKLSATAPAAASMAQGRSPRTPGSQRESHLMSHVRVALIDARGVRSHLDELRALLPKHRTGGAGATAAQDITGAIAGNSEPAGATRRVSAAATAADTQDGQHTNANSVAGVRGRDDEAGGIGEMLDGGEDSAGIVHCTTAMSPLNFSLLQEMLRDGKADDIGEDCGGGRNTLRARAGTGKASSQLQHSQGLHRNGNGVDGDGSNDGGRSPSTTLSVRGLYTSSLNAYRHQRLTQLTEQHLQSLWLGVSAVAKSVCGVTVEQCVEMDLIQGSTLIDGQALRFPSDTAAAAESAAPSLASSSFGAPLQQQLQYARPPSPYSTASTASPNSQGPLQPSGAAVSVQDREATATKKASQSASKPPPPADPPSPMPSFHFSEAPLTAATAEVTVQRLASTKRDNSPSDRHRDSQRRCLDEAAPLDSAAAGGNGCVPWPSLARAAVSAIATRDSTVTCTRGEGDARINARSSAVASTSLTTRTNTSTNTTASTVMVHPCAHSDCHRSGDRDRSGCHHSTTSPTLLSKWPNAPTSGIIYTHNTPANLSSATALPSALSNIGSSSENRMSNTPSASCSARGGSGGYAVGTAASLLSGLQSPAASTTATTAGGGRPLYTLPSTLLQLQQQPPQHGSSPQSAPSASVDGAAPPSSYASPPVATVTHLFPSQHQPLAQGCTASASASAPLTALPQHSSSSVWHSETGGSSCPLAGSAPGPTWMPPPPPPSPASPLPPAAVHRGASGVLVVAPTVPSALPSPYGATSSGVGAGASALRGLCTRSSGLAPETPFTSSLGSTLTSSLLVAMPSPPPLKAPFIKVQREEVAADTAPDSHSNARVSGARRDAAASAVGTSSAAAHARGECHGQSPASPALLLTSHERPGGGGVEARMGTAAQVGSAAAAAIEGMARGGMNGASNRVGAAAALPPAIVSPYGVLAEGELCVVAPIHESMELLARETHGSGGTPASSGATPVMMPGSPLTWRGRLEARSSSPVRRSAATGASVTTAGLVPLAPSGSSEGVEELSEPFSLMRSAATPLARGRIGVLDITTTTTARAITSKTTATTTTTTNTALPTTGNHLSLGGSMGGVAMHFSLPSTSTLRRQPQLQHALSFSSHAGSHQQDVCLHDIRSHATTATEVQGGEAASTALASATEQPLPPSQQHRTRSRDKSVGHRDAQALPFLRSSLPSDGTTPASSTPSPSAASAVSANGDQQLVYNGESDGTDAAVQASHQLATHAAAEGARVGKALNKDFSTGAASEFTAVHDSTASPPSPRQRPDEQDAASVAAHPRAASAASSSLSYTTISASTADATPAAVTAISVSGTRVPSSASSATLPAPLRAELQLEHGGNGASLTRPMATTGSALHDLGDDEDTNTVVKRSSSSEISSSSASHTPSREALLMDGARHRPLHAVLPWAQLRPPPTRTSTTASLTMHSADRADALLVRANDMEREVREVDVISALMCATSLPARPGGLATGTDGTHRPSSPTTSTLPARAEVVHDIPATEAEVRKADALVTQSKGEDGTADTPGPLAPSLAPRSWATRGGRHVGVCTDSMAAALDTEHSGSLTATAQSSDRSHMVAYAGTCSGDDRGEAGEAKRRGGAVSADEPAASDSEGGRDLLSLYVNSDAHDLPSSPRRAAAYQQALQQQPYHQRHLMQTWFSIFTISSSGHSAMTTSSLRTAITGVALSASVAALGPRLNMSSMSSGTPTTLASVAEVILGIGAAGSTVGGGSAGGLSSGHAGAIPSIGAAATATAAAGSAAASSFTVTVIAPTTAATGNSTWTPSSTVTLSSDSASAAEFTSPSTYFGTTVSSSASYSLSPEGCGIIVSGGAGGGVTAGVHSVSPTGEEGAVFLPWRSASAPAQTEYVFPVAVRAAGADAARAGGSGGGGAACDADFDALRLDATLNLTSASAESTQHVLSRLKPLPHLTPPHNYPFLLPEVTSPCPRDDDVFGEDEDDVDAYDYAQDVDDAVLLDADSDVEPEERHRATARVRGGSDHSSRVETPCCDGAGGTGRAYGDSNVEDHGAVVKSAASHSQHRGDGKVDVGASPTQPPPDSCSNGGPTLTTVAASTRTATTEDGGASLYAAVVSRTAVAHASRVGEVGSAEDDSSTEGRTSSVHLSARSLGIPTAPLTAPAGAGPATAVAAKTSSAAASAIEGNEDVRVVSLPGSGDDVPIAPSWPLLCTNTASAAPRSPRIVSDSPLRLRGAVTITAGGDALVASTATTAMAAAERERAGAQTSRSASRPHHLSGGGSALIQDGMPASNSNSGDVGGRLFPQNPTPPGAALEEGGGWAEVAATTVSEDTANALVTPGLPAMQHSSQRQTSSCATMASSVTPMAVGDGEGVAKLRDGGGRDADPAVTKGVRAASMASLFDARGIDQPNRKCVGHGENSVVGEGGGSTAVEGCSDRPRADRSISIDGDAAAVSHSAETAEWKRRHDDRRAVGANAVLSGAAPDAGDEFPIASTPLSMTPALRAADDSDSDGAVLCLLPEAARSSTVPERTPSARQSESRGPPPPPPLPPAQFSIPSYYLAQCEDGLADVAGSLHGWHAATSAFFSGADTAVAPGRTRDGWSRPSSRASDLYTSMSALARRRLQQRAFYNDAGLSGTAAPSHTTATAADTPLSASAMPELSLRVGATADHTEKTATTPTSPTAAAGATHNDRLLALMRRTLRLADGESGAC